VLTAVPWVLFIGIPSAKDDPEGYARSVASAVHAVGGYLYLLGLISLLFGLLALYAYLSRTHTSSWAGAAMIASVVGIALALPAFGIRRMGDAVLADVYLGGQRDLSAAMGLLPDPALAYRTTANFGVLVIASLIGAIAYAVAAWRSGSVPRWAGVLVGAGFGLRSSLPRHRRRLAGQKRKPSTVRGVTGSVPESRPCESRTAGGSGCGGRCRGINLSSSADGYEPRTSRARPSLSTRDPMIA